MTLKHEHISFRFAFVAALLALPCACAEDDEPGDDADDEADELEDPDDFRWSTPLAGVETLVTSLNADASGNNGGCWDTSPSGSPRVFQQYPCHARDNQLWKFESVGGGAFRIHSVDENGLCLDIPNGNIATHQLLQLFPCHNGNNQKWTVNNFNSKSATIRPFSNAGFCLDVWDAIKTNQAAIQLSPCNGGSNQAWRFHDKKDDDGLSCDTTVRFGASGPTVSTGQTGSFRVTGHNFDVECFYPDFDWDEVGCDDSIVDWFVVDRLDGAGGYDVSCFDTL
jgi:hypothetical protein